MPHEAAEYIIANAAQHFDLRQYCRVPCRHHRYRAEYREVARVVEARGLTSIRPKVMVITRKEGLPVLSPYEIDLQENKDGHC